MSDDWEENRKSGRQLDGKKQAIEMASLRIGKGGWRTFHCDFQTVKVGAGASGSVDYLARDGDFESKDKDLEHITGDRDAVKEAAQAIDAAAVVRKGRTAEKVLIKQTFELPADTTKEQRAATADAMISYWIDRGHAAVAAVHGNGEVQPHVHVAVTARPVSQTGGTWGVDRNPELVALRGGKQTVRYEREQVAKVINQHCDSKFHHGRLIDTGIERKAKKRIPQADYRRRGNQDNVADLYLDLHQQHEAARSAAAQRAKERKAELEKRKAEARERRGDITKANADRQANIAMREGRQKGLKLGGRMSIEQLKLFKDVGIELPSDIQTNQEAQSVAFRTLRERIQQDKVRAAKREDKQVSLPVQKPIRIKKRRDDGYER